MAGIGKQDVEPILSTFDKVASFLPKLSEEVRILVTQCPFPSTSDFELYPPINNSLLSRRNVTRVVKPANNVLHAPGAIQWFDSLVANGIQTVCIAGCTLTSCIRVSATDVHRKYSKSYGLQTCVDLNLCGARASNYVKICNFCMDSYLYRFRQQPDICKCGTATDTEMISPVERAVADMKSTGINVGSSFDWSHFTVD